MKRCAFLVLILLSVAPFASAAIMWNFDFVDVNTMSGVGFDDPVHGLARRQALIDAAAEYGSLFANTATIDIEVTSSDDPASPTLASAGSDFGPFTPGFGESEVVRNKVLTGGANDINGAAPDGFVDVNWGVPEGWDLSPNAADVDPTMFDFYSTMFHELNHALGYLSIPDELGDDGFGSVPDQDPGDWSQFDQFIVDINGNPVIDPTTFILNSALWANNTGGASPGAGLFFAGPNTVAANGGNPVGLYTPTTFEPGSSVSHLDDDNPALAGLLMLSAVDVGPAARTLSAIEKAMYMDIGYRFAQGPVGMPEPGTWLLLGSGVAVLLRRRRHNG